MPIFYHDASTDCPSVFNHRIPNSNYIEDVFSDKAFKYETRYSKVVRYAHMYVVINWELMLSLKKPCTLGNTETSMKSNKSRNQNKQIVKLL